MYIGFHLHSVRVSSPDIGGRCEVAASSPGVDGVKGRRVGYWTWYNICATIDGSIL